MKISPIVILSDMNIKEVIDNNYEYLHGFCTTDKVISLSLTEEDILHNVCLTAMKKFKDRDIAEKEGMDYLKLTLYIEQKRQTSRKCRDKLEYVENIQEYDIGE